MTTNGVSLKDLEEMMGNDAPAQQMPRRARRRSRGIPNIDQAREQARDPLQRLVKLIVGALGAFVLSLMFPQDLQVVAVIVMIVLIAIVLMFER